MRGFQWWLIFPVLGMGFGFFGMWLKHKRRTAMLDLIKVYIVQGREPPPELLNGIKSCEDARMQGAGAWRRAITFGSLAAGFGALYLVMVPDIMSPGHAHPFLAAFIIMSALTMGELLKVLIQRKHNAQ
jgi:hypothetical protein